MLYSLRRVAAPISLALLLSLSACGRNQASVPTATIVSTVAPTRTPRPTRETVPTAEPMLTVEPTAVVLDDSTDSTGALQPVDIGDLQTYAHDSGVFQIDIPENWSIEDKSKTNELILVWTDPSRNGAVVVDISEDESTRTSDELTETLQAYLQTSFGENPDFSMDDPTAQSDGSILIVWTYTATARNNVQAKLLGNTFIEQRGNKISLLSTLVPADQFASLKEQTNEIINTYKISTDASISS